MKEAGYVWYEELENSTGKRTAVHKVQSRPVNKSKAVRRARKVRRKRRIRDVTMLTILAVLLFCLSKGAALSRSVILRASGCPDSLIELAERQPEAYDFAKDYKKYAGKDVDINISDEVKEGKIPLFIQWDERWGYQEYGNNYMALNGCGPTCLSMVYCGLKGDTEWIH